MLNQSSILDPCPQALLIDFVGAREWQLLKKKTRRVYPFNLAGDCRRLLVSCLSFHAFVVVQDICSQASKTAPFICLGLAQK